MQLQIMKERQRWRPEEDAVLRAYVRQYGPRDWHLVPQRMNVALGRDSKSCLERWKNYLRPGIKKGSLTEEEQRVVIRLQAKHGNKWKKIAAEVPGRTAKRLGKWWEVFKEKQQRELRDTQKPSPDEQSKYNWLLESFAEKLVNARQFAPVLMATPVVPPWLSMSSNVTPVHHPPSASVTLSLASATDAPAWHQQPKASAAAFGFPAQTRMSELAEWCRELEEGQRAWAAHRKEALWRLRRVELQLESDRACRRREKAEDFAEKMRALREEQEAAMERIEAEYREQMAGLRRDAEAKEQKRAEQWAAKHARLRNILEQLACSRWPPVEMNGR